MMQLTFWMEIHVAQPQLVTKHCNRVILITNTRFLMETLVRTQELVYAYDTSFEKFIPVPRQYLHLLCSCCFTLFISTIINAEITPTAPPENDATMGST